MHKQRSFLSQKHDKQRAMVQQVASYPVEAQGKTVRKQRVLQLMDKDSR